MLFVYENISTFVIGLGCERSNSYIIESVFALSLSENVEVFKCKRTTNSTHSLYSYAAVHLLVYLPHTIQVWGIASFILT